MSIIRWAPGRTWLSDWSDGFISDLFAQRGDGESLWQPNIELSEKNGGYVVKADLAGVDKKDIRVDFEDGTLTITAEKKLEKDEKRKDYHYSEFRYGSFRRSITVPSAAGSEQVKASYKDGLLEITLPKVEEEKKEAKRISVD